MELIQALFLAIIISSATAEPPVLLSYGIPNQAIHEFDSAARYDLPVTSNVAWRNYNSESIVDSFHSLPQPAASYQSPASKPPLLHHASEANEPSVPTSSYKIPANVNPESSATSNFDEPSTTNVVPSKPLPSATSSGVSSIREPTPIKPSTSNGVPTTTKPTTPSTSYSVQTVAVRPQVPSFLYGPPHKVSDVPASIFSTDDPSHNPAAPTTSYNVPLHSKPSTLFISYDAPASTPSVDKASVSNKYPSKSVAPKPSYGTPSYVASPFVKPSPRYQSPTQQSPSTVSDAIKPAPTYSVPKETENPNISIPATSTAYVAPSSSPTSFGPLIGKPSSVPSKPNHSYDAPNRSPIEQLHQIAPEKPATEYGTPHKLASPSKPNSSFLAHSILKPSNSYRYLVQTKPTFQPIVVLPETTYGVPVGPILTTNHFKLPEMVPVKLATKYDAPAPSNTASTTDAPDSTYAVPKKPGTNYNTPEPSQSGTSPSRISTSVVPTKVLPAPESPSSTYGVPTKPAKNYNSPNPTTSRPTPLSSVSKTIPSTKDIPMLQSSYNPPKIISPALNPSKPLNNYSLPAHNNRVPQIEIPASTYGVPTKSATNYNPPDHSVFAKPSTNYGLPAPSTSETIPETPSLTYGVPVQPATNYQSPQPTSTEFHPEKTSVNNAPAPYVPSSTYGVPTKPALSYQSPELTSLKTSSENSKGNYNFPTPSNLDQTPEIPSSVYGVPIKPAALYQSPEPSSVEHSPAKPSTTYNAPALNTPAPAPLAPTSTYGLPNKSASTYQSPEPNPTLPTLSKPSKIYGAPAPNQPVPAKLIPVVTNGIPTKPAKSNQLALTYGPPPSHPAPQYKQPSFSFSSAVLLPPVKPAATYGPPPEEPARWYELPTNKPAITYGPPVPAPSPTYGPPETSEDESFPYPPAYTPQKPKFLYGLRKIHVISLRTRLPIHIAGIYK